MTRRRTFAVAIAEGAVLHVTLSAAGLAALTLWARACAAHKQRNGSTP